MANQLSQTEFERLLCRFLTQDGINRLGSALNSLYQYYSLSVKWGSRINITANLDPESYVLENVTDPVLAYWTAQPIMTGFPKPIRFLDLGTGGGYVGLTWHILAQSGLVTTVLDSDRKKINFCKQVIRDLRLSNAHAMQSRAEDFVQARSGTFHVVVSRATWDVDLCLEKARPFLRSDGVAMHFSSAAQAQPYLSANQALSYIMPQEQRRFLVYLRSSS